MVAIRRHYDPIGLFVLALACGLGGGLLRDGLFIQTGPPAAMRNGGYMIAVLAGCVVAIVLFRHVERLSKPFLVFDALGTAAYRVVGASKAFEAGLAIPACIFVGVVNAVGSGLIRDVLVREEPLLSNGPVCPLPGDACRPPCSPRTVCHLSDGDHFRVPSPRHLFQLEDQIDYGPAPPVNCHS